MKRESDEVFVVSVRIGEIFDVPAQGFVCSHHGHGLVVDIGSYAPDCQFFDEFVSFFGIYAGDPDQIEMVAAVHTREVVIQVLEAEFVADLVVAGDDLLSALQKAGIAIQLAQSYGCHDIGHVAFIPGSNDVIFPGASFCLSQGILVLAMERQKHIELIDFAVINAFQGLPGAGSAFRRGEVLDGMEREGGEVGYRATVLFLAAEDAGSTETVGTVRYYGYTA